MDDLDFPTQLSQNPKGWPGGYHATSAMVDGREYGDLDPSPCVILVLISGTPCLCTQVKASTVTTHSLIWNAGSLGNNVGGISFKREGQAATQHPEEKNGSV